MHKFHYAHEIHLIYTVYICLDVVVQISEILSHEADLDSYTYQLFHPGFKQPSAWHPQAPIHR